MEEEINRLRFENKIWILFAFLCLLNIRGDDDDINYIKTNNNKYKNANMCVFGTSGAGKSYYIKL